MTMALAYIFPSMALSICLTCAVLGSAAALEQSACGASGHNEQSCRDPSSLLQSRVALQQKTVVVRTAFQDEDEADEGAESTSCSTLTNQGSHFTVAINVGTPAQKFDVVADTGSNAVIVSSCICQHAGQCAKTDKCYTGSNRSSSFVIERRNVSGSLVPPVVSLTFGSGSIQAAIATDIVSVGSQSATMNASLLLMVARQLRLSGPFEGILGLGLPSSNIGMHSKSFAAMEAVDMPKEDPVEGIKKKFLKKLKRLKKEIQGKLKHKRHWKPLMKPTPGFLEQAKIPRFSVCLNPGGNGVLRLNQPQFPKPLEAVGGAHWALDFRGISVGNTSNPSTICLPSSMGPEQKTACAAIPDSGTTVMMAPKAHIVSLFADLCSRWPRCIAQAKKAVKPTKLAMAFQKVLLGCNEWVTESHGLDQELPPLHFNFADPKGNKRVLKLGGNAYVVETMRDEIHYVKKTLDGLFPVKIPVKTGNKTRVCTAAFGTMAYNTTLNGPVWILGLPLFYEYQVGYELESKPPGISFSQEPCGSCSASGSVEQDNSLSLVSSHGTVRQPRLQRGPRRMPNIDMSQPL